MRARLTEVELRRVELPLVTPFRTSFGVENDRDVLLVRVALAIDARGDGAAHSSGTSSAHTSGGTVVDGWGECVALREPLYSAEFVDAAELVIDEHLLPRLAGGDPLTAASVAHRLAPVKGHPMAKAALEMAVLDAELRARGESFAHHLGGTVDRVPSGVSVGIFDSIDELLAAVQGYVDEGYVRIKLKIEPGWDIEPVRRVRELIGPDMGLQVDANTAYRRSDIEHLCQLDEFDLLLVEQPMAEEDILGHAMLARASSTPVCLDESIVSLATAADAIELGATQVINIKPGRVGGYLEARRIHDLCVDRGIPVWCGGMLETGIGRAANAALASLPGFTLPGDISASSRFYARDIVVDPIVVADGHVAVPTSAGLGFELDHAYLDTVTRSTTLIELSA
jgi:o-succinylbenzoate synthase